MRSVVLAKGLMAAEVSAGWVCGLRLGARRWDAAKPQAANKTGSHTGGRMGGESEVVPLAAWQNCTRRLTPPSRPAVACLLLTPHLSREARCPPFLQ